MKRQSFKKLFSIFMTSVMAFSMISGNVFGEDEVRAEGKDYGLSNPKVAYNTRECIYFGHYWQEDTNGDGKVDQTDDKQPIKWQILSRNGNDAFILSDKVLDCKPYYSVKNYGRDVPPDDCTWETSTIRDWLNGTDDYINDSSAFIYSAFNSFEQSCIRSTLIKNVDNPDYNDKGGNDTQDKIFLLSFEDITNTSFGFASSLYKRDQARMSTKTSYAYEIEESWFYRNYLTGEWYLRSPANSNVHTAYVTPDGLTSVAEGNYIANSYGIRPALHLDLSSANIQEAGKENVSVKGIQYDTVKFGKYNETDLVWRVLHVDGDNAFLFADRIIENREYHKTSNEEEGITWKDCSLRTWLNEDFYSSSFSNNEQSIIKAVKIANDDNPYHGTEGGEDTTDKIFLLSLSEVTNPAYGFSNNIDVECNMRMTDWHTFSDDENDFWVLRSPGNKSRNVAYVRHSGAVWETGNWIASPHGVRPALYINLNSSAWTKEERVIIGDVTGATEQANPQNPIKQVVETPTEKDTVKPTDNTQQSTTSKPTSKPITDKKITGVGTLSSDRKTLTDTFGKKYSVSGEIKNNQLKKNLTVADSKTAGKYKISKVTKKKGKVTSGNVTYMGLYNINCKKSVIPATVKIAGATFNVTAVNKNAYKGCKKLTNITIGDNVTNIGASAFNGCAKLKTVNIKTTKLSNVGSKAYKGINSKAVFKVPKSIYSKKKTLKAYTKLIQKGGAPKKVSITK